MRILYVTTIGSTMSFFKTLIRSLLDMGDTVDIATNVTKSDVPSYYREWGCNVFSISTSRSPLSFGNLKAVKQIRLLAQNYDIIHCHTPIAGIITRFACRKLRKKNNIKVFYTAHGFHFYKGAPLKNWLMYYPFEKMCSRWTDVLITINKEDYFFAKRKMKAGLIEYVPGVGVDVDLFETINVDRVQKRMELGIPMDSFLLLSVGELNSNKNHKAVIEAISHIKNNQICYAIAGKGGEDKRLKKLADKLKVNLVLLGFRNDVLELYKIADLYIHPSFREGLPVSVMEAIASKVNVACSDIRGCRDLVSDGLFNPKNCRQISDEIKSFMNGKTNYKTNYDKLGFFSTESVDTKIIAYYHYNKASFGISKKFYE